MVWVVRMTVGLRMIDIDEIDKTELFCYNSINKNR